MSGNSNPPIGDPASSIQVDHRSSRSGPNHAIQKIISVFSSLILKCDTEPAGSPKLHAPEAVSKQCDVFEYELEDTWMYRLSKTSEQRGSKGHKLFYFAGGGFRGLPTKEHWLLCTELVKELPDFEVNLVSYPLAPHSPAPTSMLQLRRLYKAIATQSKADKSRITLMGDSAGGSIALLLAIYGATEFLEEGASGVCPVDNVMAICPAVDHRNTNPDIDVIDPSDPILSRKVIEEVSEGWRGEWLLEDPRISPLLADLSPLKQANIKVDGVIALFDVLSPDAILFIKKLAEIGVAGHWIEWEKQMHCFPLMFSHHVKESVEAKDWMLEVLRKRAQYH
jgi:acetyl esterase/lipase